MVMSKYSMSRSARILFNLCNILPHIPNSAALNAEYIAADKDIFQQIK